MDRQIFDQSGIAVPTATTTAATVATACHLPHTGRQITEFPTALRAPSPRRYVSHPLLQSRRSPNHIQNTHSHRKANSNTREGKRRRLTGQHPAYHVCGRRTGTVSVHTVGSNHSVPCQRPGGKIHRPESAPPIKKTDRNIPSNPITRTRSNETNQERYRADAAAC